LCEEEEEELCARILTCADDQIIRTQASCFDVIAENSNQLNTRFVNLFVISI
jgi:hypothetical protein